MNTALLNRRLVGSSTAPDEIDPLLLWSALGLLLLGLVMVYSASIATAEGNAFTGHQPTYYLIRHAVYLAVGLIGGLLAFQIPLRFWQQFAPWIFVGAVVLLIVVLIPGIGRSVNGAQRWIGLGPINLQPSELMKFAVVIYAADYVARKLEKMDSFRHGFLPMAGVMLVVGGLLLREPDFGAFVVVVSIAMGILFLGGINGKLFAGLIGLDGRGIRLADLVVALPARTHHQLHGPVAARLRQGLPALSRTHRLRAW
jgi:cell division protein FtsW